MGGKIIMNDLSEMELRFLIESLNSYCTNNHELKDCLQPLFIKINFMIDNYCKQETGERYDIQTR